MNINVNGIPHAVEVPVNYTLLDVLRLQLGLTGTKESCLEGRCGACTVLLDQTPVTSCLVLGVKADGRTVLTIEGLAYEGSLHPLQEAFVEYGGTQCGYCTPGMILAAKALLDRQEMPTEHAIRQALHGNLCRCTGYTKIIQAVQAAAQRLIDTKGKRPS